MSSDFIEVIKSRGFVHQFTDEEGLQALLKSGPQKAYIGFDCTAPSLHVGSLLQIMLLRWWQKCGHTPIVLLGGGTTKIGDPSGKDESRPPLSDEQIVKNMAGIKSVFAKFLNNPTYVDNDEWLSKLNYIRFLREIAPHFSINRMLKMDSVKLRVEREQELSLLEFNYMVLQAYDFVELHKKYGCRLQMGGSDQWGNILMGLELNRRLHYIEGDLPSRMVEAISKVSLKERKKEYEVFGITSPLITTSSGAKMGKTAEGAVWLNEDKLSAYDYWQFWRNTEDADVIRFMKLFTELTLDEIGEYAKLTGSAINEAKIILATEATALLHGRAKAEAAEKTAAETFAGSGVSETLPEVLIDTLGMPIYEVLVKAGFAASNGEARRLIKGNGVKVNDTAVTEETAKLTAADMTADKFIKLSAGKKRHALIKLKA